MIAECNTVDRQRSRRSLRKLLILIDELAGHRRPVSVAEIRERVIDRFGERVHDRTIKRDLILLESLGLVIEIPFERRFPTIPAKWKLSLERSELLQLAAMKVSE